MKRSNRVHIVTTIDDLVLFRPKGLYHEVTYLSSEKIRMKKESRVLDLKNLTEIPNVLRRFLSGG